MSVTLSVQSLGSILRERRSVRNFTNGAVDDTVLLNLLDGARWAPSPHNSQPWRFVIVRAGSGRERLASAMADRWLNDLADHQQENPTILRKVETRRRRLLDAPAAIVVCLTGDDLDAYPDAERRQSEWLTAEQSLGAAVQNVLLATHAAGLGACWICAPSFCEDTVRLALDLTANFAPRVLVLIGHPAATPPVRDRHPLENFVVYR